MKNLLFFFLVLAMNSYAAEPVVCQPSAPPQILSTAQNQMQAIERAIQCEDLKLGESFVVDTLRNRDKSPTRIPSAYSIEKTGEKRFKSRINLNFIPDKDVKTTPAQMIETVRSCIRGISPFFRGPSGEVLDVEILNSEDSASLSSAVRPPEVPVKIVKAGVRAENIGYPEDIDCKTIGHEILHLMGLADEYSTNGDDGTSYPGNYFDEQGNVVKNYDRNTGMAGGKVIDPKPRWIYAYNCRVVAQRPSMMKVAAEIFLNVVPTTQQCRCVSEDCKKLISSSEKVRSLYLANSVMIVPDSDYRMNYCTSTTLPPVDLKTFEQSGEFVKLNSISSNSVDYEYANFSDPNYQQVKRTRVKCTCDASSSECMNGLERMKKITQTKTVLQQLFCPKGSEKVSVSYGAIDPEKPNAFKLNADGSFSFNTITSAFYDHASLLQPNHFERIVGGLCGEKAKGYNRCTQFFLTTDPKGKCDQVPPECKDANYFLGEIKK